MRYKRTNGSTQQEQQKSGASRTDFLSWLSLNVFTPLASLIFLAFWRLRQSWNLLLLIGIGMIVSVTLVCTIPLYTLVATSAGVRGAFTSNPQQQYITINGYGKPGFSLSNSQQFKGELDQLFQQYLGNSVNNTPQFVAQTAFSPLANPHLLDTTHINYAVGLNSYDMQAVRPHIQLVQGRLPENNTHAIEIILTPDEAATLHIHIGDVLTTRLDYTYARFSPSTAALSPLPQSLSFQLVGLFNVNSASDLFWHGNIFQTTGTVGDPEIISVQAIVSTEAMFHVFDAINSLALQQNQAISNELSLSWAYQLNVAHLDSDHLSNVLTGLNNFSRAINSTMQQDPLVQNLKASTPADFISTYLQRIVTERVPLIILTFVTLGLLLLFTILMSNLLVDRQTETIAVLRSRGASQRQIFSAFSLQGLFLGVVALLIGPLLAPALASLLTQILFGGKEYDALNLIASTTAAALTDPFTLLWSYPFDTSRITIQQTNTVASAINTLLVDAPNSLNHPPNIQNAQVSGNVAKFNQYASQTQVFQVPVTLLALLAITAYAISTYVTNSGLLDAQSSVLIAAPLEQIAPLFLLFGILLIVLRLFPLILRTGAFLALRGRGALNMLALSQMAHTSGQVIRLTLLLIIAVAFLIFSQVLSASQSYHLVDVADFQVGSNFSGTIASPIAIPMKKDEPTLSYIAGAIAAQTSPYLRIPGVLAASPAYVDTLTNQNDGQQVAIQAIDTNTFAQTVTWTGQDSKQPLSTLMNQLTAARNNVGFSNTIPAIVDAAMWNALNLSQSETFSLSDPQTALNFVAISEVQHIPTIVDGNTSGNSGANDGESIEGGIIVDYQNYITSYITASATSDISKLPVHINYMWLKTTTNPTVLAHIRRTLTTSSLQLNPLNDNAALLAQLQQSTTQHNLISMISFVAVAPLLLALVGSLLASWMSVRSRLTSFAVLRALGCTPRQVASTLSIELIFVYVSAIILGCLLGLIFAFQTVPHLVFTDASSSTSSGAIFLAQSVPAVRAIIPNTLVLLLGLFILLCLGTLALMVYTVSRPATGQTLRVNED